MSIIETIINKVAAGFLAVAMLLGAGPADHTPPVEAPIVSGTVVPETLVVGTYPFVEEEAIVETGGRFGANQVNFVGGKVYTLQGSGVNSSATSIILTSFDTPVTNTNLVMSDFGSIGYGTIEPQSSSRREFISFTSVTQNGDGTATLTGVTRGLSFVSPYTASSTLQLSHSGGSRFIISNPPQLYNEAAFKGNNEVLTGFWEAPDPLTAQGIATRQYVLDNVTGGSVSFDQTVIPGTAGDTLSTSTLVYFDQSDQEWKQVDTDTSTTYVDKLIGLTQGDGTDGNAIQDGVLIGGRDSLVTGLSAGSVYYATTSAGSIDTTESVLSIGVAEASNVLLFQPILEGVVREGYDNTLTGTNTFSGENTFNSTTTLAATSTAFIGDFPAYEIGKNVEVITSTGTSTWSVPSGVSKVKVEVVGGGGAGANGSDSGGGGGGGGGGYALEMVDVSSTSTIQVFVGSAGNKTEFGTNGEFLSATAGSDGSATTGGAGGSGSSGDLNVEGADGGTGGDKGTGNSGQGGQGGNSHYGGGGNGGHNKSDTGDAGNLYGGGGGGGGSEDSGGSGSSNGASGAQGVIIITY